MKTDLIDWRTDPGHVNGLESYSAYVQNSRLGTLCFLKDGKGWSLQMPCAEINLRGKYRIDLMEESQVLYSKFVERHT